MLGKILRAGLVLLGDAIDGVGSGESRDDLHERIRKAADRGAELALENSRLRDKVDELRFNGPTLWRDEVEALWEAITLMQGEGMGDDLALRRLIGRCDHMPMTQDELNEQCRQALEEGTAPEDWNDTGTDLDPFGG